MNYNASGSKIVLEKSDVFEELEELLGTEAANRFVDFYSGSSLYVPKHIINERKYQKIREEFRNGAGYRELALRYGYSERYVRTIIHEMKRRNHIIG
jgi:Mor family transcriptional regulator